MFNFNEWYLESSLVLKCLHSAYAKYDNIKWSDCESFFKALDYCMIKSPIKSNAKVNAESIITHLIQNFFDSSHKSVKLWCSFPWSIKQGRPAVCDNQHIPSYYSVGHEALISDMVTDVDFIKPSHPDPDPDEGVLSDKSTRYVEFWQPSDDDGPCKLATSFKHLIIDRCLDVHTVVEYIKSMPVHDLEQGIRNIMAGKDFQGNVDGSSKYAQRSAVAREFVRNRDAIIKYLLS